MKKSYVKPCAEIIEFQPEDEIMDEIGLPGVGGSGGVTESIPSGPVVDPFA